VYAQGLYVVCDIAVDIGSDIMFKHPPHPFERWMKRTAGVPRGLLRFYVFKLLNEKPMSGSEIMEEIESETDGRWKPSPGSIYPLLTWLQDNGYAKKLPKEESGIKRYALTEEGKKLFKEQVKFGKRLRKKLEFLAPLLISPFLAGINSEKLREIREPAKRFVTALFNLRMTLEENLSEQTVKEAAKILNEGAEKIEEITERIKRR
jgi:DNA-binding PadR family transcriptional regulator